MHNYDRTHRADVATRVPRGHLMRCFGRSFDNSVIRPLFELGRTRARPRVYSGFRRWGREPRGEVRTMVKRNFRSPARLLWAMGADSVTCNFGATNPRFPAFGNLNYGSIRSPQASNHNRLAVVFVRSFALLPSEAGLRCSACS